MNRENEIRNSVRELPVISNSMLRLLEVVSDKDHSAKDVIRLVECDTAITAIQLLPWGYLSWEEAVTRIFQPKAHVLYSLQTMLKFT